MATPQPNIIATIKAMPRRAGEQVPTIGVSRRKLLAGRSFFIEIFWLKGGERQEKIGTPALPERILLCGEHPSFVLQARTMRRTVPGFTEDSVGRKLHCMSALSPKGGHPSTHHRRSVALSVTVYLLAHTVFGEES